MKDFLDAILDYLEVQEIGIKQTDLFGIVLPGKPYACVCVNLTGGVHTVDDPIRSPTIQILIRCTSFVTGIAKAESIFSLLNNQWNILTDFRGRFAALHEAGMSYRDENNHIIFPLNFIFYTTKL